MESSQEHRVTVLAPSGLAELRPKQERFAQLYASHGNAVKAYREAFDCDPGNVVTVTLDPAKEAAAIK